MLEELEAEVGRFRAWADTYPIAERDSAWESMYRGWQELSSAFSAFVNATTCQQWSAETTQMLLYTIARDNEMEALVKEVARNPDNLVCLAERAVASGERDAKWQLAVELGHLEPRPPQVESLLLQFAYDEDLYVQRRAMMALADIGSAKVEELVVPAWESGDEHQRMGVLYALWKVGSPQLDAYLAQAEADGRPYLTEYLARVRVGHPM